MPPVANGSAFVAFGANGVPPGTIGSFVVAFTSETTAPATGCPCPPSPSYTTFAVPARNVAAVVVCRAALSAEIEATLTVVEPGGIASESVAANVTVSGVAGASEAIRIFSVWPVSETLPAGGVVPFTSTELGMAVTPAGMSSAMPTFVAATPPPSENAIAYVTVEPGAVCANELPLTSFVMTVPVPPGPAKTAAPETIAHCCAPLAAWPLTAEPAPDFAESPISISVPTGACPGSTVTSTCAVPPGGNVPGSAAPFANCTDAPPAPYASETIDPAETDAAIV